MVTCPINPILLKLQKPYTAFQEKSEKVYEFSVHRTSGWEVDKIALSQLLWRPTIWEWDMILISDFLIRYPIHNACFIWFYLLSYQLLFVHLSASKQRIISVKMIENKKGLLNCFKKIRSLSRGFFFSPITTQKCIFTTIVWPQEQRKFLFSKF